MPSLGADMEAGTVIEWLVAPGDEVHRGDIVAVVDTDKADVDVEIFENGVVEELLVAPGTKVVVGTPLARIRSTGRAEAAPTPATPATRTICRAPGGGGATTRGRTRGGRGGRCTGVRPGSNRCTSRAPNRCTNRALAVHSPLVRRRAVALGVDLAAVIGSGPEGTVTRADVEAAASQGDRHASPRARRLATELGVDLGTVAGTGPAGTVTGDDVAAAASVAPALTPAAPVTTALPVVPARDRDAAMRRAIATRMERANREIPHYYLEHGIDLSRPRAWLDATNAERPVGARLIPAVLLLKATARAAS